MIRELVHTKRYEKHVIAVLVITLILLAVTYVTSVSAAIVYAVDRGQTEKEIASLEGELSELEYQYVTLRQTIDLSYAYDLGFKDAGTEYISRTTSVALSSNVANVR